jgi:hypothetical protein
MGFGEHDTDKLGVADVMVKLLLVLPNSPQESPVASATDAV